MWSLTIRSIGGEPRIYTLHPGTNTLGRMSGNDIVILDPSASRYHAQFTLEPEQNLLTIQDLGSTNGTYVNRDRVTTPRLLSPNDVVRIGQHVIELNIQDDHLPAYQVGRLPNTQPLTRDLVLESLDQHAVLLSEIASRLNTILNLPTALHTVANLMKVAMGADRCEVILVDQIDRLAELGFARSIAQQAIQQRSAVIIQNATTDQAVGKSAALLNIHSAMCVPIVTGEDILGLIYVFKNRQNPRPFDKRDLQLAVAISHQTALTIQRMRLVDEVRRQEMMSGLLHRFLSPQEMEFVLKEYLATKTLPAVQEHYATILAANIRDSTQLAERVGARRFGQILSRYYTCMTQVIFQHNGLIGKSMGDGLMAIFGLPHQPAGAEERAIQAALAILDQLEDLKQATGEEIEIGIGINSGLVMAGYIGTDEYVEFTAIGYPANIAWALEVQARPNRILIGCPTYQLAGARFNVQPIGLLELAKPDDPVQAYEVLPPVKTP